MDKTMNDPIEQRIKALELKIEFLENWKNTPFIQVTLPVILSLFLATSWGNFALASLDKRIDLVEKRLDKLESRLDKLESKMDRLLAEFSMIKSELKRS